MRAAAALLAVVLGAIAPTALAQEDLPARVGRIADLAGAVSIAPAERADQWEPAGINQTVVGGDNLWVSTDGRAEVDYGGGQFRLASDTSAHVARLDERTVVLFVAQGTAVLRVRVLDPGDVAQVDTPNAQVQVLRPGLYRIDVRGDGAGTLLSVREGEAGVYLASGAVRVLPGQTAEAAGPDPAQIDVRNGSFSDEFDAWSAGRDRRYEQSRSATYVSRQMIGYADLDEYGTWEQYPDYGAVWFPTAVAADWAPYRYGRWSSVAGFGWTWVDDAPWGYAPFHYGRWAYVRGRWGWVPGGWVARPAWAPALVAWYGGPSWSYSASVGGPVYGWVPLGWGEPYLPWWSNCSHRCWTAYNRPYAVRYAERPAVPPTRYVNQVAPGGFTAVPRDALVGGQRVSRAVVSVPAPATAGAPVLGSAPLDVRPMPARVPGPRAGTPGAPPLPASTFYPSGRPTRTVAPPATPDVAAPGRPGIVPSPPAAVPPGRPAALPSAPPSAESTRRSRTAQPIDAGVVPPRAPSMPEAAPSAESTRRPRTGQPVDAGTLPPRAPSTQEAAPSVRGSSTAMPPPTSRTTPAYGAPASRSAAPTTGTLPQQLPASPQGGTPRGPAPTVNQGIPSGNVPPAALPPPQAPSRATRSSAPSGTTPPVHVPAPPASGQPRHPAPAVQAVPAPAAPTGQSPPPAPPPPSRATRAPAPLPDAPSPTR